MKVLDFGLAKLMDTETTPEDDTSRGVRAVGLSAPGTIAGTAAYMSPEQAAAERWMRGATSSASARCSTRWSRARGAFAGTSIADTLNAVIRVQPKAPSAIVPAVPSDLEKVILRCLRKDPDRRFQHIADVKVALQEIKEDSESGRRVRRSPPETVSRSP